MLLFGEHGTCATWSFSHFACRHCPLGTVIPTLLSLRTNLSTVKHMVKSASPLLIAVLDRLQTRSGPPFEADELGLLIASVILPQFHLRWCTDDDTREEATTLLRYEMTRLSTQKDGTTVKGSICRRISRWGFFTLSNCSSGKAIASTVNKNYTLQMKQSFDP